MTSRNDDSPTPKSDPLALENQLCSALHSAARAIASVYAETLQPHGLSYTQYLVLISLLEKDGLHIKELGERLDLDSGTLTPTVKRMEAAGFVQRRRDLVDERKVGVFLTDQGRRTRPLLEKARAKVVERLGMSSDDLLRLRGELVDLSKRLRTTHSAL